MLVLEYRSVNPLLTAWQGFGFCFIITLMYSAINMSKQIRDQHKFF